MINVPTELVNDAVISGVILVVGTFISIVFKQSKAVSLLMAKILVTIALKGLNAGNKWSKHHSDEIQRLESDWHILKTKLGGKALGHG
jgi:hypothetical protein